MENLWNERFKLLTSSFRMLPSFIIPGETKCGTTTFFRCLERHPLIASPDMKEPNNFIRYGGTSPFCRMHYPFFFQKILNRKIITGEASVEYLSKKDTAVAIKSLIPDVKLIILLRNPIRRAFSDFLMMKAAGREPEEFDFVVKKTVSWLTDDSLTRLIDVATTVDDTPLRYLTKGIYVKTLATWLNTFPKEKIKIIKSERFFKEPQIVLNETFDFLGIGHYVVDNVPHHRKARLNVPLKRETVKILAEYFQPFNDELEKLLGPEFSWKEDIENLLVKCN